MGDAGPSAGKARTGDADKARLPSSRHLLFHGAWASKAMKDRSVRGHACSPYDQAARLGVWSLSLPETSCHPCRAVCLLGLTRDRIFNLVRSPCKASSVRPRNTVIFVFYSVHWWLRHKIRVASTRSGGHAATSLSSNILVLEFFSPPSCPVINAETVTDTFHMIPHAPRIYCFWNFSAHPDLRETPILSNDCSPEKKMSNSELLLSIRPAILRIAVRRVNERNLPADN